MEYRNLGNTGLKVSEISLGTWITFGGTISDEVAKDCVKAAFDCGINVIDTADVYHTGKAEITLAKILKDYKRSDYVLATKCFGTMGKTPNDKGLSRKHVIEACDASLQRMEVDYIDLYQCHRYDVTTPLEETVRAMTDLIRSGKVHYWGVSQWSAVEIANAVRIAERYNLEKPVSNQPIYNMLNRGLEVEVMGTCANEGLGLIVYSPLAQGILTGKYKVNQTPEDSRGGSEGTKQLLAKRLTEENLAKVEELSKIANELEISMPQLALAWLLRAKPLSSVIIGASRPSQVTENAKASGVKLSQEVQDKIEEILGNAPVDQYTGSPNGYGFEKKGF
ncbi:MAG: aldo/keto reductase [Calditrichaeota bacterium]|nr:MAG: aldo/keto reductase [Calditrichota bacterium]